MQIARMSKLGGLALLGLVTIAGLVAALGINTIRIGGTQYREIDLSNQVVADLAPPPLFLVEAYVESRLLAKDPVNVAAHKAKLVELEEAAAQRLAFYRQSALSPAQQAELDRLDQGFIAPFWAEVNSGLKPAVARGDMAGADASLARLDRLYDRNRVEVLRVLQSTYAHREEIEAASASSLRWTTATLILALLAIMGGIVAAMALLRRKVVQPLAETADVMDRMAAGDLDAGRREIHADNELGMVTRAMETFRQAALARREGAMRQEAAVQDMATALDKLAAGDLTHRITGDLGEYARLKEGFNTSVAALADMLQQVAASAGQVGTGSAEIRAASDDLATRNECQAASLEETSAAMSQVTDLVRKSALGAAEARQAMNLTHEEASQGGAVVEQAIAAMSAIESSSSQINQIIDVIDGIAFQTNLLALNAGVEAARAGDAGKGFAVVANEVRALAQRSADAARHIKDMITTSSGQVERGVSLVGETGRLLQAIVQRVDAVRGQVEEIAEGALGQATRLEQVNAAVAEMDRMTQQNAAMVEQSTAAARSLAEESAELKRLVSQFRVSATAHLTARSVTAAAASILPHKARRAAPAPAVTGNLALKADEDDWDEF